MDVDKCVGCGACVSICPQGVYEIQNGKSVPLHPDGCLQCHACQLKCPRGAITVSGGMSVQQRIRSRGTLLRKILSSKPKDSKSK